MRYEEFLAIPFGAVVEFRFPHHGATWRAWLASSPCDVVCAGGAGFGSVFRGPQRDRAPSIASASNSTPPIGHMKNNPSRMERSTFAFRSSTFSGPMTLRLELQSAVE